MTAGLDLAQVLAGVRRRIEKAKSASLNEQNTKGTLIEPVLRALGWDIEDADEVVREYRVQRRDNPVDYALVVMREPKLLVEAKALGEKLDDRRWATQIMGYATLVGAPWVVLTNGDEYRIYNSHASVGVNDKLLCAVRVTAPSPLAAQVLRLLAKKELASNRIVHLWQAHFVDRQVKAGLDALFGSTDEMLLVNYLLKRTKDLNPEDIRRSLRRCTARFDFPLLPDDILADAVDGSMRRKRSGTSAGGGNGDSVTLRALIAAGILRPPIRLLCQYKGKDLVAQVEADGTVSYGGERHATPSAAAGAARASIIGVRPDGEPPHTNGWTFWRYAAGDGEVVPLDHARRAYTNRAS